MHPITVRFFDYNGELLTVKAMAAVPADGAKVQLRKTAENISEWEVVSHAWVIDLHEDVAKLVDVRLCWVGKIPCRE